MRFVVRDLDLASAKVVSSASPVKSKAGFGGGAALELELTPWCGVEVGGFYVKRKMELTSSTTVDIFSSTTIQIPAILRLWAGGIFTVGGGLYYSLGSGNLSVNGADKNYSDYGISSNEFGYLGVVGFNFRWKPWLSVAVEGRYMGGIYDVSLAPAASWKYSDKQVLLGLRLNTGGSGAGG